MPGKKSESEIRKMVEAQAKGKGVKKPGEAADRGKGASELDERVSKEWKKGIGE